MSSSQEKDHEITFFEDTRTNAKQYSKSLELNLNSLKLKSETVPSGSVSSLSESKISKLPDEKKRKISNDKKERFDKISLVIHQYCYAVNIIDSSVRVLVYEVIDCITIKKTFRKEEKIILTYEIKQLPPKTIFMLVFEDGLKHCSTKICLT